MGAQWIVRSRARVSTAEQRRSTPTFACEIDHREVDPTRGHRALELQLLDSVVDGSGNRYVHSEGGDSPYRGLIALG